MLKSHLRCLALSCISGIALVASLIFLIEKLPATQAKEIVSEDKEYLTQASRDSHKEVIDQVWQIIFRDFLDIYGSYSAQQWKNLRMKYLEANYPTQAEAYAAIRQMLGTLKDPRMSFYTPSEFTNLSSGKTAEGGPPADVDNDVSFTKVKTDDGTKIGYIRIHSFGGSTTLKMNQALAELEAVHVKGYIIDLRDNSGGILRSSIEIAKQLMSTGIIVSIDTRTTGKRKELADGTALTQMPLVVLINKNTASAAEILAGALQFNQRALIVGSRSAGHAHTIRAVRGLSDGSGLIFTTAVYEIPGEVLGNKEHGIIPSIEVKARPAGTRSIASMAEPISDNQYDEAIRALSNIIRAKYKR